jgi:phosphoglycerate dehydrogenase-like enzyme
MKIVIASAGISESVDRVRAAHPDIEVLVPDSDSEFVAEATDAEVVFDPFWRPDGLAACKSARWIQTGGAGVEKAPLGEIRARGLILTNAAGVHAIPVADTALALLLGIARRVNWAVRNQLAHRWAPDRDTYELVGKTAGLIALGGIGIEVARRLKGFQMRIIGVDVNPGITSEFVDEVRHVDDLGWLLGQSDVVVVCAPDTPATHHMFNSATFAQMKPGSIFVNVSRGGLTRTADLIAALESGHLWGAGLDVVDEEPLGRGDPLWRREDVLITPHIGGASTAREERLADLFIDNIGRYKSGRPLRNVVDLGEGY